VVNGVEARAATIQFCWIFVFWSFNGASDGGVDWLELVHVYLAYYRFQNKHIAHAHMS
jgi:hypothetical protein